MNPHSIRYCRNAADERSRLGAFASRFGRGKESRRVVIGRYPVVQAACELLRPSAFNLARKYEMLAEQPTHSRMALSDDALYQERRLGRVKVSEISTSDSIFGIVLACQQLRRR